MRVKVDPRTGKIISGVRINRKPIDQSKKKEVKKVYIPVAQQETPDLSSIAKQIGQAIVAELKKIIGTGQYIDRPISSSVPEIVIDESIIDVGLEPSDELNKGAQSSSLGHEIEEKESLSVSKSKLKKILNRGA